jgi:hypothetical protein
MKLATITGHVAGPGVEAEEKDDYRYSLGDTECSGSKRTLGFMGKQVCRAPVNTWHINPND